MEQIAHYKIVEKIFPLEPACKKTGIYRKEELEEETEDGRPTIFLALDTKLDCHVVLKVVRLRHKNEKFFEYRRRLLLEALVLSYLKHPNIPEVFDIGLVRGEEDIFYFAMEYISGEDLDDIICDEITQGDSENKQKNQQKLLRILVTICQTVDFIHRQGLIHGDIQSGNIRISDEGEIILLDYECVKLIDPTALKRLDIEKLLHYLSSQKQTAQSAVLQRYRPEIEKYLLKKDKINLITPEYSPIEKILYHWDFHDSAEREKILRKMGYSSEEDSGQDQRTDIFALGVILYEILTGVNPFWIKKYLFYEVWSIDGIYEMQASEEIPPPEHSSRELVAICQKTIARKKDDRFSTAKEMADAIQSVLDNGSHSLQQASSNLN